ncbi:hypothetical protein GIB67_039110 [Kingdonia uniflora]|uniref:Uncharacterized protein n=1 Tax=Kingdonia uniflora TaxID=39325 RepID=A0A7J7LL10_9MAGN|nr:hypothetical protein GIB67_039110 [Kingdonia uniflora]
MKKKSSSIPSSWFFCSMRCFYSCTSSPKTKEEKEGLSEEEEELKMLTGRKPGGWKSMPYILGNETFERLAAFGLLANFMVYLLTQFHMEQTFATNVINIWSGTTNFAPLMGAFLSDAYFGRFKTLACASISSLTGMIVITLTAVVPDLRPPGCTMLEKQQGQCIGPSKSQLGVLFLSMGFLTIGAGGIRPCSIPFGVDQFDPRTKEGRNGINSFFNWYYFSFTIVIMIALTLIVYIQDNISWVWGLGLPTALIILSKAAFVVDGELKPDGTRSNKWRLCSIQQIEEVKCLIRIVPIWASGIIFFLSMAQQGTFTVSQALKMDRHLGPHFQIPAGSLGVFSMLTVGIWLPIYDRILVPRLQRITKKEGGITLLQRMGIGMVFSILSMVIAGLAEEKRRASAVLHARPDGIAPISVLWLVPQLVTMGFAEAFNLIGQIEFYYKQFPEHMKSIANSLLFCTMAGANYLSSVVGAIVHNTTGKHGKPDWLDNNINRGRVDYYYYVIAGLGVLNFIYFLVVADRYRYKGSITEEDSNVDVELSTTKNIDI